MGQVVNLFQLAHPSSGEGLAAPIERNEWDDELRQPLVGIALVLLSSVGTLFMLTSALRWIF